ncbi:MAG: hypothetical protein RMX68_020015 [Aulosira sp. ZfuVER01]|nr:hypothetical protein [Aulosira sp. ZfuVER01]MDZ7999675.1 hypothetical protein [Aulosira sp. DedVER01a]MDZ8054318.1 hypothetical protein [Aulosira sp. ZfuCHP01]
MNKLNVMVKLYEKYLHKTALMDAMPNDRQCQARSHRADKINTYS